MVERKREPKNVDLSYLSEQYDAFLIDQFGVLHDGVAPYSGAVSALEALKSVNRSVALISNSGKRSAENQVRIRSLGFPDDSYDVFLTSGEIAWTMLSGSLTGIEIGPGDRCLFLSRDDSRSAIDGLDLSLVDSGEEADVVLLSGSRGDRLAMDHYKALLEPAARRNVPCICTNPDKIMLTPTGPAYGAGAIADLYEKMGGKVTWIGKPFPAIYDRALALLDNPDKRRVCCIGDSIEHDIAGGARAGLTTALVRSGILADKSDEELSALFDTYGATPDHILSSFSWPD